MIRVLGGAVLIIAGIAAFIEAHSHAPEYGSRCVGGYTFARPRTIPPTRVCRREIEYLLSGHLSRTPYDLLRIGAWALVIVGGLLVVMGLIRYWRAQGRGSG